MAQSDHNFICDATMSLDVMNLVGAPTPSIMDSVWFTLTARCFKHLLVSDLGFLAPILTTTTTHPICRLVICT